jgi:hypothetical protein
MSKVSKRRPCPALGRDISVLECGQQRLSALACPADCPHNPFTPANYSQLLEIEERLDHKSFEQLTLLPDRAAIERGVAAAMRRGINATNALFVWNLFFAKDAAGTTVVQRWEKSGWANLKNDERVLLRAKTQMRVALLEIHRVFAGGRVEAVDLLSPEPATLVLQDRNLAAMGVRFATLLAWVYPLPHFWRLCGAAVNLPEVAQLPAREIIEEIARHLGASLTERELRRWLAEHFARVSDALEAVGRRRWQQTLAGIDAKHGKAVYELRAAFAPCRDRLDALPDVDRGDLSDPEMDEGFAEARDWFDGTPNLEHLTTPDGRMMLGRVLLGQSHWRLEAFGAEKLARLRRQFEEQLGEVVRFQGERLDDLGARMSAKQPAVDESLVPPRLLENPEKLGFASSRVPMPARGASPKEATAQLMREADRAFLDQTIPALENRTPREAARDPALRPRLIELVKRRVRSHDDQNLRTGRSDDINWLLRELELHEINFDPPPWRPPPPGAKGEPEDGPADEPLEPFEATEPMPPPDPSRPPAPPLPATPLDMVETGRRLQNAATWFASAAKAEQELAASGATILEDVDELTLNLLEESEFYGAIPFVLQVWFALVPKGCRAPEIPFPLLEAVFTANLRQIQTCVESRTPKLLESLLQNSPQPDFMLILLTLFLDTATKADKKLRPSAQGQAVILALLKTMVEQLDVALGRE